ncbi:MAG: preprotein translocase subunit SecG [Oscillospiraceae bacterium]|nr:preprotein translocase subunit SecG [Oscillospiraceae bacterium]
MGVAKLIITIIQVLASLFLICVVLLQSGKNAGLSGAIAGAADSFMAKNKATSLDAKLAKGTKWVAAIFVILTFVLNLL